MRDGDKSASARRTRPTDKNAAEAHRHGLRSEARSYGKRGFRLEAATIRQSATEFGRRRSLFPKHVFPVPREVGLVGWAQPAELNCDISAERQENTLLVGQAA